MYDNICKFLAENYSHDFARWVFGEPKGFTTLSPTELNVEPIRADALIFLQSSDVVLHLEFQTQPDEAIPFRMADYRLRVHRRYPHKDMRQLVIYLKPTGSGLVHQNSFNISGMNHEFEVIRLWEQPIEEFLGFPGLLPLAILGRTKDKTQTLQEISSLIDKISNKRERSNIAAATSLLAGLVLKKDIVSAVLREEIMRDSVIYQDIKAQGVQEGLQQGVQQGKADLVLHLLKIRLGKLKSNDEARISALSLERLEALGVSMFDFSKRDDLLAWLADN